MDRLSCQPLLLALALTMAMAPSSMAEESGSPTEGGTATAEIGADGIQRARIVMDSYSYSPKHLIVQAGKPVELTLTSVTTITPHNFVIDESDAGFRVNGDIGAGKTGVVRFTPSKAGTFPFYCDKKLLFFKSHREKGMEGRLEVR
jgi:heme/copper-type cytochrome/quinol oxidase subunit 2